MIALSSLLKFCLWIILPVILLNTECWGHQSKSKRFVVTTYKEPQVKKSPVRETVEEIIVDDGSEEESKGRKSSEIAAEEPKDKESPVTADESVIADDALIFANIVFRHGERNIIHSYPKDPWRKEKNPYLWTGGYGTITKTGKRQLLGLGKFFRRRYKKLLNGGTHPLDLVYVQTSDVRRTKASAESCVDGFFPKTDNITYKNGRKWQPIPIRTISDESDYTIRSTKPCAQYKKEQAKLIKSTDYKNSVKKYAELFKKLGDKSGLTIESFRDVFHLYDTLNTEKLRGLTLPEWTEKRFNEIERVAYMHYKAKTQTKPLGRLRSGFLIRDMLDHFNDKIKSKLKQSIWIYSGHDATVFSLLNTLDVLETLGMHVPTYAATVLFELYKSNDDYYVQLFYKKTTAEVLQPIDIPNCGTKCPLKSFQEVYKDVLPTGNFEKDCRISDK